MAYGIKSRKKKVEMSENDNHKLFIELDYEANMPEFGDARMTA